MFEQSLQLIYSTLYFIGSFDSVHVTSCLFLMFCGWIVQVKLDASYVIRGIPIFWFNFVVNNKAEFDTVSF